MKIRKTRIFSLLTALMLCVSLLPVSAYAAETGVTTWTDTISGSSARIVSVDMIPGRTGQISLANNSVVEAMSAQTHINTVDAQADTHVVAAINGGFFNSYTTGTQIFPDNCAMIADAVVADGQLVHTGRTSILGFTSDGTPMVDWVTLKAYVDLGLSTGFQPGCWSVNTYESDPWAIMLFDEHLTLPVTIPSNFTMFYIENGKITKSAPGSTISVPAGTQVLVYGPSVLAEERSHDRAPETGMSAKVTFKATGTDRDSAWEQVQTALSGGPVLVKNGVNVVDDSRNSPYYGDPKQQPDVSQGRAFIGITNSGSLVMGTVSSTFRKIADWMVANGIKEGLAMDGGASATLYASGSFVTPAGRNLASMLTIVDKGAGTGQTATQPSQPTQPASGPSAWAVTEVQNAISAGLVPQDLQNSYQQNISRQDFCRLIWTMLEQQPDCAQWLQSGTPVTFLDTTNEAVLNCARLSIISGKGEGNFAPNDQLKRSEAAKILALTIQRLGVADSGAKYTAFTDRSAFGWAEPYIDFCGVNNVMNGDNGAFNPDGSFTHEQAIATILRIARQYGRQ